MTFILLNSCTNGLQLPELDKSVHWLQVFTGTPRLQWLFRPRQQNDIVHCLDHTHTQTHTHTNTHHIHTHTQQQNNKVYHVPHTHTNTHTHTHTHTYTHTHTRPGRATHPVKLLWEGKYRIISNNFLHEGWSV